jgi:hypothetical protein
MSTCERWCVVVGVLVASPLGCGTDASRHPAPSGSGASAGTASLISGGTGASATAGSAASAGGDDSGEGGAAGAGSPVIGHLGGQPPLAENGGAPASLPAVCDSEASWGEPIALAGVNTADADERLLAMTHDELSLVFSRADKLFVADRSDADADFGAPVPLALPTGYTHERGLSLSADGRALVIVSQSGDGFAELARASRSGAFGGAADTARFAALNDNASFYGGVLSAPVLAASGQTFFYTQRMATTSYVFRARGKTELIAPEMQDAVTLGATDGKAKLGQSVSVDERVIFVFDEALGHAAGLWSATATAAFTDVVELPGLESAFTNVACSRLYGTGDVSGSLDVVMQTPN